MNGQAATLVLVALATLVFVLTACAEGERPLPALDRDLTTNCGLAGYVWGWTQTAQRDGMTVAQPTGELSEEAILELLGAIGSPLDTLSDYDLRRCREVVSRSAMMGSNAYGCMETPPQGYRAFLPDYEERSAHCRASGPG